MVGHPLSAFRPSGGAGSAFRSIKRRRGRPPATGSWTTLGPALPSGIPAPPPSSHSRHSLASRLAVSVTGRGHSTSSSTAQSHTAHAAPRRGPRAALPSPCPPLFAESRASHPFKIRHTQLVTPVDVDAVDCFRLSMHSISLEDSPTIVSQRSFVFSNRRRQFRVASGSLE